ncbi:hypothetical protein Clacol_001187 [Clathrus columnatus]|uniref:Jacalin-type lectin domain-containing protein n=1 Tax=Clathrus columnatus TaxID=1419009 RepID=A0AAV4ZXT8_9AGAM|nr:hypothetical protein Clacol_001187 [Clathrus columnatus]
MSTPNFINTNLHGGGGGTPFDEQSENPQIVHSRLVKINYWTDSVLNGIQLEWDNPLITGTLHGSASGSFNSFTLSKGERIIALTGRSGSRIDTLTFITNSGRSVNFGGSGGAPFQWAVDLIKYPNAALHHFIGRRFKFYSDIPPSFNDSGSQIDALEAVFITEHGEAI